jgi:hypothetical protein
LFGPARRRTVARVSTEERPMTRWFPTVCVFVCGLTVPAAVAAQAIEADQHYLVLEVAKLSTFDKEVGEATSKGFKLLMSTTSDGGQRIQALMERVATPPAVYQYRMVATFSEKTGDQEMNAAGAEGFRVVPHTAMVKKGITIFNINQVVIMEKAPNSSDTYQYQTISAVRTSTFHRELKTAVDQGWAIVDMTYGRVLLERKKAGS